VKLAEALALRADATRRVEQLRARIVASARFQEAEESAEDAQALLAEATAVLDELETLIRRINRTNAAADMGADGTITDALPPTQPPGRPPQPPGRPPNHRAAHPNLCPKFYYIKGECPLSARMIAKTYFPV